MYIKALENRVAELEMAMTNGGCGDAALDHWTMKEPEAKTKEDDEEAYSPLAAVRDVSLNTSGSFIGGTSTLTLARMLESILGNTGKDQLTLPQAYVGPMASPGGSSPEYRGDFTSSETGYDSRPFPNAIRAMQSNMAERLLLAYFKHVAVNFPVVHSAQIKDFHRRRQLLDDPYEESVLNLVYALGGQFLETVSLIFLLLSSR